MHKLLEQFSTLYRSKMENFAKTIFDIVTTYNDEISYVGSFSGEGTDTCSRAEGRSPESLSRVELELWRLGMSSSSSLVSSVSCVKFRGRRVSGM